MNKQKVMKTKTMQTLLVAVALSPCLLAMSPEAGAAIWNEASYWVQLYGVQAPNTGQVSIPGASETQQSSSVPVQVAGSAGTGPNYNGYGAADGYGFARAEAGVLGASAFANAYATAQPGTNVGARAGVSALATFTDSATFTPVVPTYQNLLIVSGSLLLTGDIYGDAQVRVGGKGLNPQSVSAEWTGDTWPNQSIGRQKSAGGVYSPWTPGSPTSIPFSFTVYGGQPTDLNYWLAVRAGAAASFQTCVDSLGGGLCDVVQTSIATTAADYSHTLAWGGVNVTDWFGAPISFSTTSTSGFNYAVAYSAPVPVPAAVWLFGSGLLGLIGVARRNRRRLG